MQSKKRGEEIWWLNKRICINECSQKRGLRCIISHYTSVVLIKRIMYPFSICRGFYEREVINAIITSIDYECMYEIKVKNVNIAPIWHRGILYEK